MRVGRLAERLVPVADRQLTGDDGRAELTAVLDHFGEIGGLASRERLQCEIVDEQDLDPSQRRHQTRQPTIGADDGEII